MPELVTSTFQRTNEVYVYEYQYKLTFSNIYLCAYIIYVLQVILIAAQNVPSLADMYGYIDAEFSIQFQMVY